MFDERDDGTERRESLDTGSGGPRIRCPRCGYEPRAADRWWCTCNHSWNTFDTRARCPGCGRQWHDTACPACHEWSPHDDWYTDGDRLT